MKAGTLDRRITIEQPVVARDPNIGSQVVTWSPLATVWAEKRESSTGYERLMMNTNVATRPTRFRLRWRADVTTEMRVNEGGRLYQIMGTAEIGRRLGLELACMEFSHE